eukprot:4986005-Amphidinium_carterae.1
MGLCVAASQVCGRLSEKQGKIDAPLGLTEIGGGSKYRCTFRVLCGHGIAAFGLLAHAHSLSKG